MTAAQWLVLDNLQHDWDYWTNLDKTVADEAYLWCIRNEFIKDGKITAGGFCALLTHKPKTTRPISATME